MKRSKLKFSFACFVAILGIYSLITAPFLMPIGLGAVILNGILGGGRNKVGPVIMSKWKGIDYIKKYFIPANPNTPAQQVVRAKFAAMVAIAQSLLPTLIPFAWDPFTVGMSGFNDFFRKNYDTLDGTNHLTITSVISKGTLEKAATLTSTYNTANGVVLVDFDDTISGNGLTTDITALVIYDKTTDKVWYHSVDDERTDGGITFSVPSGLTATNLISYLFLYRGTGVDFIVSDSDAMVMSAS